MSKIAKIGFATAALITAFASGSVKADTDQSTVYVSANITAYCTINGGQLFFGNLSDASVDADASVDIDVYCTDGTPYDITVDQGDNSNLSDTRMKDINNNYLVYDLYTDSLRTSPLAYSSSSADLVTNGTGTGGTTTVTLYGRIESTEVANASSSQYYDSLTLTITY